MAKRRPGDADFYDEIETGMVSGFEIDHAKLALQRCLVATMDKAKWRDLGYRFAQRRAIEEHPRLLRSLDWGDDDYGSAVFDVLDDLLGSGLERLKALEDYLGLPQWLKRKEPELFRELYADQPEPTVPMEQVEEASGIHNVAELNQHVRRIRAGIDADPAQAIGSSKELLETVLKTIVGDAAGVNDDISTLLKKARAALDLDPAGVDANAAGAATLKRTLSSLGQIVQGVAEVRNLHGTGHGRVNSRELEIAQARLVVNAAVTIATFLLELSQT